MWRLSAFNLSLRMLSTRVQYRCVSSFIDLLPSVTVEMNKERHYVLGNPLVYDKAVFTVSGDPQIGDEVTVKDHTGRIFARGFYNPYSMYRIRIMALKDDTSAFNLALSDLLLYRIKAAVNLRKSLCLPSCDTNVYRLINSEGDKLGGLIVEVLGDTIVIQSSAIWVEKYSNAISDILRKVFNNNGNSYQIVWKQSVANLKKDGFELFNSTQRTSDHSAIVNKVDSHFSALPVLNLYNTVVMENSLKYTISPGCDQKTGYYCDQRDNKLLIGDLAKDKTVLDAYCYTGGFTMSALRGGATHVTAIDSSESAIKSVHENIALNSLPQKKVSIIEGDCEKEMQRLVHEKKHFGLIICDPPKLAPNRQSLRSAVKKYTRINALAMQLIDKSGGLLFTCTCSAAMSQSDGEFTRMLSSAAKVAKRQITVLKVSSTGGDHPVCPAYPEGKYLTCVLLYVC